jgi:hypothetical protein
MEASLYADRDGSRAATKAAVALRAAVAGIAYVVALWVSYYYGGGFGQEATLWLPSGVAIGVLAGAVSGRYHYAVDAVAGAVVGVAAWAMTR